MEIIASTKHYTNAYVEVSRARIIHPFAAEDSLRKYLLTVPVNTVLPFGGD